MSNFQLVNNQSGHLRVAVNNDGTTTPVKVSFDNGEIVTIQHTGDYLINKPFTGCGVEVTEFFNRPHSDGDYGLLTTQDNENRLQLAKTIRLLMTDAFEYMWPRTHRLDSLINDIVNRLLDDADVSYDGHNENHLTMLEQTLQPFWDDDLAVPLDMVGLPDRHTGELGYFVNAVVIYANDDGVYDCADPHVEEQLEVVRQSKEDSWLVTWVHKNGANCVDNVNAIRIKGEQLDVLD